MTAHRAPPRTPPAPARGNRRHRVLAALAVAALVAAVVVALDPSRTGLGRCAGGGGAVLLPTAEEVPDVVGVTVGEARERAAAAGVARSGVVERWQVDGTARGTVLAQAGGACGADLVLTVSTGGPLVDTALLPPAVQRVVGTGPVREVEVGDGRVWLAGGVLSGQCGDVRAATAIGGLLAPGELATREVRCVPDAEDALRGAVLRGLPGAEVWQCEPGTRCRAGTADGGWLVEVGVRSLGTGPQREDLRCSSPSAYEVCAVSERADGSRVRTRQLLDEFPPGVPYLTRRVRLLTGPWQVDVLLAPRFGEEGPLPERPAATPLDGPALVALADAAGTAVAEVEAP